MKKIIGFLTVLAFLCIGTAFAKSPKYYSGITLNPERTVILHGVIREQMIQDLINQMLDMEQIDSSSAIYVIIDSPGGYVSSGWKFINTIKAIKSPMIGVVAGRAYSMAAIISLYFDKLYMVDSADMMFHEAAFMIAGSETIAASRFKATMKQLGKLHKRISEALDMPLDIYKKKIRKEWWLLPEEASQANICDGILKSLKYEFDLQPRFFILEFNQKAFDVYMGTNPPDNSIKIGF